MATETNWFGWREVTTPDETTRYCQCGASFTWSGLDPRLEAWMAEHGPHRKKIPDRDGAAQKRWDAMKGDGWWL